MTTRPMDVDTCLLRLHQLALANVEVIEDGDTAQRLQDQINQDHERVESVITWATAMNSAVDAGGGDFSHCIRPPRLDLAAGALAVAMGTTTDPEVKPWLQTALDFISGNYEPLDTEDGSQSPVASDGEGISEGDMPTEPKHPQGPPMTDIKTRDGSGSEDGVAPGAQAARPQTGSGVGANSLGAWPANGVDTLRGTGLSHFYDPHDWECTFEADQLDLLEEMMRDRDGFALGNSYEIATMRPGPTLFAMRIPTSFDDDGEYEDSEIRLFSSRADAEATLAAAISKATGAQ